MKTPIVYRDGVQVVAAGPSYTDMRYGVSVLTGDTTQQIVLNQDEARELAAALAWIIGEVDAAHGYESFKPRNRRQKA